MPALSRSHLVGSIGVAPGPLAGAVALILAGCAGGSPAPPPCPRPAIVNGLETIEVYRAGETGTPADLAYRGAMLGFGGGCAYESGGVRLQLTLDIVATPGPAYAGQPLRLPYFVAVTAPDGTLVHKQPFTAELPAPSGPSPVGVTERLEQRIADVSATDGPGYRVLLGFEVPRGEALRRLEER